MSHALPVLRSDLSAILFHREQGPVSAERFLGDAQALAARLPGGRHVVNLCTDRYRFTVGFIAALLRGQVTLLPASATSAPLTALTSDYRDAYFLTDADVPEDLGGADAVAIPEFPADRQAVVLFTSGSTGTPLPYPRSWGALVASTLSAARAMGLAEFGPASLLGTVPHQHSYGIESAIMLPLQHGFIIHDGRPLLPADIAAALTAMTCPRILVTTPVHLRSLAAYEGALPRVDRIISATAPLTRDLALKAEEKFGAALHEIYGCSEVGQIASRRTVETAEWRCIDGIVLQKDGDDVRVSGIAMNDMIDLHGPDRFTLLGRKSDMINIAGHRSSLSFLNFHLNAIEGVVDGVFVMPEKGERLTAYIVAPGMTADTILAALRRVIDPPFLPRPIHLVDVLPRNEVGKLSRQAMEELARAID